MRSVLWTLATVLAFGAFGAAAPSVGANDADTALRLVETYKRSMLQWRIDYDTLTPNRAGAACIPWDKLDDSFLDGGIFDALGYTWQIAGEPVAIRGALEGCERMRQGLGIEDTCECEVVLFNDEVRLPVDEPRR